MHGPMVFVVGVVAPAVTASAQAQIQAQPLVELPVQSPQNPVPAPPSTRPFRQLFWERTPQFQQLKKYGPDRGQRLGVNGRATIRCAAHTDGTFSNCEVVSEAPSGFGFGDAALRMAPYFKLKPFAADASDQDPRISIPIYFNLDDGPPAPPAPDTPSTDSGAVREANACEHSDREPGLKACTWVINSALWSPSRLAWAYERRGDINLSMARNQQAIADFNKLISLKPKYAAAYTLRAEAYLADAALTKSTVFVSRAIQDYSKAIALRPDLLSLGTARARAYRLNGDDAQAMAEVERIATLAPKNSDALETRAEFYEMRGWNDAAILDYRAALKAKPDMKEAVDGLKRLKADP